MNPTEVQTQFKGDINTLGVQVKIWIPDPQEMASRASGDPFAYQINTSASNPLTLNLVLNLAPVLENLKNPVPKEIRKEPFLIDEPRPAFKPIIQEKPALQEKPVTVEKTVTSEKPMSIERPAMNQRPTFTETLEINPKKRDVSDKYACLLI